MNILDKFAEILGTSGIKKGFMPNKPDTIVSLFEYSASPPEHHFGGMDLVQNVQARIRDTSAAAAFAKAKSVAKLLNRYHDKEISIIQTSPILDIGLDGANPQRQEYTVNFEIRRY